MPEITLEQALPGTNVPSGAQISPAGQTGPAGVGQNAFTATSGAFTVPAVGSTTTVTMTNVAWIVSGQMVYIDQAGGGGAGSPGILQVVSIAGNTVTLLNPQPPPTLPPLASASTQGLMNQTSGNTTDFIDGTNNSQNLVNAVTPTITSVRLRSFNAVGNPCFEVDQANVNTLVNNIGNVRMSDRWFMSKSGTLTGTINSQAQAPTSPIKIPGTNFAISRIQQLLQVGTTQASLAAGDYCMMTQQVEGPMYRELSLDSHSISILVNSSNVAPFTFAVSIRDSPATKSLVSLVTSPTAGVYTLLTIPNLPVFPAGNFTIAPASLAYTISICIACGTTYQAPVTGSWQSGNYLGASGMTNGLATGNNFYCAFVQHEPGPVCTQLMDLDFDTNLSRCQRYYQKTYNNWAAPGAVTTAGVISFNQITVQQLQGSAKFSKTMAKVPTVTIYNWNTGAANALYHLNGNVYAVSSVNNIGDSGFDAMTVATMPAVVAGASGQFHYTADTGW